VYDRLFVSFIRGRWPSASASVRHSITLRTGKECRIKQGRFIVRKLI
jgi:hypothetical protein